MCKNEIEEESHVLFSCKAYMRISEKTWFNGSHTAAVADVSHVMSDDYYETTIWEVSRLLYDFLQKRNDTDKLTHETDVNAECWMN